MKKIEQSIFILCVLIAMNSDGQNILQRGYPPTCTRFGQVSPDIYDCQAFFLCNEDLFPDHMQCARNLSYDNFVEKCVEISPCSLVVIKLAATITTVEPSAVPTCITPGEMFPDIYDCQAFFVCDGLVPYHWHCTNNLYYNYLTGTCDMTSSCSWVVTASTATTPATTTPAAEPSAVPICTRPAELFPDIYDCQAFFACDDYLSPIHWQCANNLYYNHIANNCDETSTCAWTVTTSVATTTTEPSAIPTCTKPAEMFPDIYDCHAFYICDDKLVPIPWHCTNNLYYNAQTEVCDIESSCSWTVPTTTTATITGPRAVPTCAHYGQMFPDLYDCHAFFLCDGESIPNHWYCDNNLYYNAITENCGISSSCSWIVGTTKATETLADQATHM